MPLLDPSAGDSPEPSARLTGPGEILLDDQSLRWRAGRAIPVEDYLARHPGLAKDDDLVLDLIYHEVLLRLRQGEVPRLEDYLARFPHLAAPLHDQFAVHHALTPEPAEPGSGVASEAALPTVPGYDILGELGRGAMGVVYEARQRSLKRLVALKMIRPSILSVSNEEIARFRAEAAAVARLQHANIVQIYEVGESQGAPFFSMEYVAGGSLAEKLDGTPLPTLSAARLLETIARAVQYAHEQGVVHRDLKPANILLAPVASSQSPPAKVSDMQPFDNSPLATGSYQPKVTDFGLAKQIEEDSLDTRSGVIVGTPSYMAPEQARGKRGTVGPASDVYALGAILYELLTGQPPFKGDSVWETLDQVVARDPIPPRQLHRIPRDLETICLKCLEKEPGRRYATALELADDLRRHQDGDFVRARPAGAWEQTWKWVRRHPTLSAVCTTALALGLVLSFAHYSHLRNALQEALEGQELQTRSGEVQEQVFRAETAVTAGRWNEAQRHLTNAHVQLAAARERFPDDSRLAELKRLTDGLQRQVRQRLSDVDRLRKLQHVREQVGFYATGFTGLDDAGNRQLAEALARESLALSNASSEGAEPFGFESSSLDASEMAEAVACYAEIAVHLSDLRAEAAARQAGSDRKHSAREALRLLDRASGTVAAVVADGRRARLRLLLDEKVHISSSREEERTGPPLRAFEQYLTGTELYRGGKLPEAMEAFRKTVALQKSHYGAQYALAVCHLKIRESRSDAARTHLALAVAGLTQCIDRQPGHAWPYLLRGYALTELDDFTGAEADFTHVEQSTRTRTDESALYGVYVNRGLLRLRQKLPLEAAEDFGRATRLKPDEYAAHVNLARALQEQQKWDEAIGSLDRAVALRPELVLSSIYRNRARLHLIRKDFAAALNDLDAAILQEPLGPKSPAAAGDLFEKGLVLLQKKEHALALDALDDALLLQPAHMPTHRARAEALLYLGRFADAAECLDRYLALDQAGRRSFAAVYAARGQARATLGKFAAAAEDYTRALELDPDNATLLTARGWAYLMTDASALALADFELVLRRDPKSVEGLNGRGFARVRLGQWRTALKDAEEALQLAGLPDSRTSYNAARIFAQAVAQVEIDTTQQNPAGREMRLQLQDRGVTLLRNALSSLPAERRVAFWRQTVQADAAFDPIRRNQAYLRLAEAYPAPPTPIEGANPATRKAN